MDSEVNTQACQASISFDTLIDYVENRLQGADRQKLTAHINNDCPACGREVAQLERMLQAMSSTGPIMSPPPALLERSRAMFRERYPKTRWLEKIIASLSFDSRTAAVGGERDLTMTGPYQLLYTLGEFELDIQVVPPSVTDLGYARYRLVGQILPYSWELAKAQAVLINAANGNETRQPLSKNGEFQFDRVAPGNYTLGIELSNKVLVVQNVELGDR